MIEEKCYECGTVRLLKRASLFGLCRSCGRLFESRWNARWRERMDRSSTKAIREDLKNKHFMWRALAAACVAKAVKTGVLASLSSTFIACVDCGRRAVCWEHRDYGRPLHVVPCCQSCNFRRGKASTPWHYPLTKKRLSMTKQGLKSQKDRELRETKTCT